MDLFYKSGHILKAFCDQNIMALRGQESWDRDKGGSLLKGTQAPSVLKLESNMFSEKL